MKQFVIFLCFFVQCFGFAQPGSFDTTFNGDGRALYCFPINTAHFAISNAFQSDGKILCLSHNNYSAFELVRFNTDGTLDTTFGTNGYRNYDAFPNGGYYVWNMVVQPDDKIVVTGLQQNGTFTYPNAYWVARLLPNGDMDTSFNGTGYLDVSLGTPQDRSTCIALQPDGKILLGGTSGSTAQYFTMIRLTTTGAFDTTFGINGVAQTAFDGSPQSWGTCIAVQPDGKLVMGGFTQTSDILPFNFGLVRYLPNGTLDTTFGTNGKVVTDIVPTDSDQATDVLIQPDGKIILAGIQGTNTTLLMTAVRYFPNGTLDMGFATNGILTIPNSVCQKNSVALQTDGKLIFGGGGDSTIFRVYRYNSSGIVDTTFGNNGFVDGMGYAANKVLIQSDNKIVVGGGAFGENVNTSCNLVIRLNPSELGVEEFAGTTGVVYPNPTTGVCNLQLTNSFANGTVQVYDVMGRKVMSLDCARDDKNVIIDLTGYPSGVYLCEIQTEEGTIRKKIIKQ